jgi:Acyl carrier protein
MLKPSTPAQIETVVHEKIRAVLLERFGQVRAFAGTDKLNATLGLSSLDLAFLVAELEAEFGVIPSPRRSRSPTFGPSMISCAHTATPSSAATSRARKMADLAAAMQRAASRQARRARK